MGKSGIKAIRIIIPDENVQAGFGIAIIYKDIQRLTNRL